MTVDILMTGASGFLGRNLIRTMPQGVTLHAVYSQSRDFPAYAREFSPQIKVYPCDLTDSGQVEALGRELPSHLDAAVLLAARVNLRGSQKNPLPDMQANLPSVLLPLLATRGGRIIYLSSGAVYDGLVGEVHPGLAVNPTLPYATHKLTAEQYVKYFVERKRNWNEYVIVRFYGAYGPWESPNKVFTRLVTTFALQGRSDFEIYGDGTNLINAMYVDDAVDALWRVVNSNSANHVIDLPGPAPLTIEQLVRDAAATFGRAPVRIDKRGEAAENIRFFSKPEAFEELYGPLQRTPLSTGLHHLEQHLRRQRQAEEGRA